MRHKPSSLSGVTSEPEESVLSPALVRSEGHDFGEDLAEAVALQPMTKADIPRKGILVDVLRPAHRGDNTNFGISSKQIKFVLVGEEVAGDAQPTPDAPALVLIRRGDRAGLLHAEPPAGPPAGTVGFMFGGNFVWSADALFPNDYPIPIHDRLETEGQHELLSSEQPL